MRRRCEVPSWRALETYLRPNLSPFSDRAGAPERRRWLCAASPSCEVVKWDANALDPCSAMQGSFFPIETALD